jgi:hypothetical protein
LKILIFSMLKKNAPNWIALDQNQNLPFIIDASQQFFPQKSSTFQSKNIPQPPIIQFSFHLLVVDSQKILKRRNSGNIHKFKKCLNLFSFQNFNSELLSNKWKLLKKRSLKVLLEIWRCCWIRQKSKLDLRKKCYEQNASISKLCDFLFSMLIKSFKQKFDNLLQIPIKFLFGCPF